MTLQGGSLTNTVETVKKANKILLDNFPEVKHAVCKIGAGEIPTDPTPMETGDYIITLKDKDEWTSAATREELVAKMEEKLVTLAGVKFEFQQPIQMRFNELMSGSRQDVAVKIYGDDLEILAEKGVEVENIIRNIKGVEDINVEKVTGLTQVQVEYNRQRLAQYGLSVDEVNRILRAAFAGSQAGVIFENEQRFALVVRLDKDYRQSLDDVKNISVALPNGALIPFEQIADISLKSGPAQVSRENTRRRITVGFNVRNADIASVIKEVSSEIDQRISLPPGYYIDYGGQFRNFEAAKNRLAIAVPVALALIFLMLYFTFHSVWQTLLIFTAVPLSAIGGVFALWSRGMNFSISAGVGFIALFGVAVLNGIVLIAEFNRLEKEGVLDVRERVLKGLRTRLRPVIMTAAVASLGFLPMALSRSAGAEVQKPLATVVIGGLISATFLTLVVLPVFYSMVSSGKFKLKMKRKSPKTTLLSILVIGFSLSALVSHTQPVREVSREEAIRIALDSNLKVQSSLYQVDAEKALKGASWNIPKTVIDGEYGQFNSYQDDNSFTLSQSMEFPSVYVVQGQLAQANIESRMWLLEASRLEIATEVKLIFGELAYLYSTLDLLEYQDSLFSGFLRAAELRARAGETNNLEVVTARSKSLEVKNQLHQVNSNISIYLRKLQVVMNSSMTIIPTGTDLSRMAYDPLADSLGISGNPNLGFNRQQVQVANAEQRLEVNKMLPDLTFGYFSQTMIGVQDVDGVPQSFGSGDRFNGFQAGITLPVFFGPSLARIKAAKIKEEAAATEAEYFSRSLMLHYHTLLEEYGKYSVSVDYYEQQAVPEADLIISQATLSYKSGDMDYLDYVLMLGKALEIKQSYLDALKDLNMAVISLEYITGKIL